MALYHMWAIAFGTPEAILFRGTHLLFAIVLIFLLYRWTHRDADEAEVGRAAGRPTTGCRRCSTTCCWSLGAAPILYLFVNYEYSSPASTTSTT